MGHMTDLDTRVSNPYTSYYTGRLNPVPIGAQFFTVCWKFWRLHETP